MRIILPNPDNTYIMSDPHYMHTNINVGCTKWASGATRPYNSPEEMSETLVNNVNETVGRDDWLISLGDWAFGGADKVEEFCQRLRCRNIIHVYGNHDQAGNFEYHPGEDRWVRRKSSRFTPELFTLTADYLEFRYKKVLYCCMHYPLASWNESGRGSICLSGHCHGNLDPSMRRGRSFDMGVDVPRWNFRPVRLPDIHAIAMKTPVVVTDHHTPDLSGW